MKRPVIGVTGPDRGGAVAWWFTALAIWRAGGRPQRITPGRRSHRAALQGVVLGGGADVEPRLYGAVPAEPAFAPAGERRPLGRRLLAAMFYPVLLLARKAFSVGPTEGIDPARDRLEGALLRRAMELRLPVLGICRGAQLLNVYFEGTLHQDISSFYSETPQIRSIRPRKSVAVTPGTRLESILKTTRCPVNALHKQAINKVGRGLRVAAREDSSVVQAIEHHALPFVIGVQWHPEYLPQHRRHQRIFHALVAAARSTDRPLDHDSWNDSADRAGPLR